MMTCWSSGMQGIQLGRALPDRHPVAVRCRLEQTSKPLAADGSPGGCEAQREPMTERERLPGLAAAITPPTTTGRKATGIGSPDPKPFRLLPDTRAMRKVAAAGAGDSHRCLRRAVPPAEMAATLLSHHRPGWDLPPGPAVPADQVQAQPKGARLQARHDAATAGRAPRPTTAPIPCRPTSGKLPGTYPARAIAGRDRQNRRTQ